MEACDHKYSIFIVLIILITTNMSFSVFLNICMWLKMKLTIKLHKVRNNLLGIQKRNLTRLRDELIELNKHGKYITFLNYKDVL